MTFREQYEVYRRAAEEYLEGLFSGEKPYKRLQEAMRYSLLAGGKRVRPVLTQAFCVLHGGDAGRALPLACAVELVHTYSLIHDDLPCMDNDDLRRGKPSCHVAYGEAVAVLAGDALQAEAFGLLARAEGLSAEQRCAAVRVLSAACGGDGMVAGQTLDLEGVQQDKEDLKLLDSLKTGAMFRAAAELGCIAAGADREAQRQASEYAAHLGLAFQVRDDMLDVTAGEEELGKNTGSDQASGKRTYVNLLGLKGCEALAAEETNLAKAMIGDGWQGAFLRELADSLLSRSN